MLWKPQSRLFVALAVLFLLILVLACSTITAPTQPQAPGFDATKASLELQATAMSLQLTQVALNNAQPESPPQVIIIQPTLPPSLPTVAPTPTNPIPSCRFCITAASGPIRPVTRFAWEAAETPSC